VPLTEVQEAIQQSSTSIPNRRRPGSPVALRHSMYFLSLFVLAAVLPWWNRYVGVTNDAWHYFYGGQILVGKVPYRDFYLFVPPLYPLKNALLIFLFGNRIIVPHLVGIAEIVVLVCVLMAWITRVLPVFETMVGVTVAIALYILSASAETLGGLHQEAVFLPILAGWMASVALRRRTLPFCVMTGVLAGLALLAKQTTGLAVLFGLGLLLPTLLWRCDGIRRAQHAFLSYVLGVAIPWIPVCSWLGAKGALGVFISDTFVRGSSSKGPLVDTLLRSIIMIARQPDLQAASLIAVTTLAAFFLLVNRAAVIEQLVETAGTRVAAFVWAAFAALACGFFLSRFYSMRHPHTFVRILPRDVLLFFGEFGCLVLFALSVRRFFGSSINEYQSQFVLLAGLGCALAYAMGCSWANYPGIVLPSLAFVIAYVLSRLRADSRLRTVWVAAPVLCILVILQYSFLRLDTPFRWGGWQEPNVRLAVESLPESELAGFRASPESAGFITRVTQEIEANSRPGDAVLAYPDIPIFYVLAHRLPATFAYIHYIDVAPDFVDHADAERILRDPPAVIVYWEQTEEEVRAGEVTYRHGGRSGVRDMVAAIDALKPQYRILDTFETSTGDRFIVMARSSKLAVSIRPSRVRLVGQN